MLLGVADQTYPAVYSELIHQVAAVEFHRTDADIQQLADLAVRIPLGDQA